MSRRPILISTLVAASLLGACAPHGGGWHWENPQNPASPYLQRDLYDCRYYASLTDPRAFNAERPVDVQEWDESVQECMAKRGWIFVDPNKDANRVSPRQNP